MQQVNQASYYSQRAQEAGHPHLLTSLAPMLDFLVFFRESINSYSNCFVSTGSGRIRLDPNNVFSDELDLKTKHENIIAFRHKYVSHSDSNEIESTEAQVDETECEIHIGNYHNISFAFDHLYDLIAIVQYVEENVVDRLDNHLKAIEKEVCKPVRLLGADE